ncbi:MAG: hypothetical protein KGM98_08980 [Bacteroidota bacterium]|nr:hypothetical protein [Bacteroidota bacterium]
MKRNPTVILLKSLAILALGISCFQLSSCKKMQNPSLSQVQTVDTTLTDSTIYLDITLNGTRVLAVQKLGAGPYYWGTLVGINPVDSTTYGYNRLGSVMTYQAQNSSPAFGWALGNYNDWIRLYYYNTLPSNFVDSFFAAGNYNYSVLTHDTTFTYLGSTTDTVIKLGTTVTDTLLSPGINMLYSDNKGVLWQTFWGSTDQTGSYFTIQSVKTVKTSPLVCMVTASFACKLYDQHGNVLTLTNGKGRFLVYL